MAKPKVSREERMSEIQEKLLAGIKEIYESGKWAEYISVMSKFPNYSINNCILIASQCPQASYVCGYKKWEEFNRNVVKGATGIMIIAPVKRKVDVEELKYDADNHPVLNADGTQSTETVTREFNSFRPCYVFDLSQTEGEPLPSLVNHLEDSVEEFEKLKEVLMAVSPVPIFFEEVPGDANGFFSPSEMRIVVQEGMADYISQATGYSTRDSLKQLQGFEYVVHLKNFHVDEIIRIAGWDKLKECLIYEQVYPFMREGA